MIANTLMKTRILIEPLLFGDFYVAVYDEKNDLLLDKKYFTPSLLSANMAAVDLKQRTEWRGAEIYLFDGDKEISIYD